MPISRPTTTPILIVGGGLVGLSAALFLQHLDVPFILIEKSQGVSPLPRARGIHVRTMELFRQIGLEEKIRETAAAAWRQGSFGGARRGRTLVDAEPVIDVGSMHARMAAIATSPSSFTACPQTLIEPVLRQRLEACSSDVRFGHELVSFSDIGNAIAATIRGPDQQETVIEACWMIGADGGGSPVRRQLGIATIDTPPPQHLVNIFFHADLARTVEGKTFSQCEVANAQVRGLFLSMDNAEKWSFHLEYDPASGPPAVSQLPALVRAAIGKDVAVSIQSHGLWNTGVRVASRYRSGRTFLCGDAAHLMPPWGGFNATTGIADAHNLAWKMAAVLRSEAPESLLDSYDAERRPQALRNGAQALLRTDFDARFGIETKTNQELFRQLVDSGALLLRYRYPTPEESDIDDNALAVSQLQGQTGTRFPHAWIRQAHREISTLDLFGDSFVLLAGPAAHAPVSERSSLHPDSPRIYQVGRDIDIAGESDWHHLTGLPPDGDILVRPDGFVLRRSDDSV